MNRQGVGGGQLTMNYAEISAPTSTFQLKDAALRAGMNKASGSIDVIVPYLTNTQELRRGDSLGWQK